MKGTTNTTAKSSGVEKVNLILKTNQSSHDILVGSTFTVSYGDYSESYTWEGSAITIEVPANVDYTVLFSAIDDYITPSPISYTSLAGNRRTIDVVYVLGTETLTVIVNGIPSGYMVSVINASTGDTIGFQTSASKIYSITAGTKYYVKGSSVSSYITPSNSSTYTAVTGGSCSVTMTYVYHAGTMSPTNGVYIQDTDGFFHTESEWDGNYTPNGIAVITSNCRFVIALDDAHSSDCQWGGSNKAVSGIMTTTDSSTATTDYSGESNTTTIISALNGYNDGYVTGAPAAEYCRAYTFPNGKKGYLGAVGEWQAALDNKDAIESALSKCGSAVLGGIYYWTSTQCDSINSWCMNWLYSFFSSSYSKTNNISICAFTSI